MLEKIRYRLVYNRKKKLNKQGEALVQVEASQLGRRVYFSTRIYLKPECWDKNTSRVCNHPLACELNAMLYDFIVSMQRVEIDRWKNCQECSVVILKEVITGKRKDTSDFLVFAEHAVSNSDRAESTKENIRTTIKALRSFRMHILFTELTYPFLKDFESYLRNTGNSSNTVCKHMRQLRTLVNEAINYGYISQNKYPFRKYKIKKENPVKAHLSWEDISSIENMTISDYKTAKIRDAFLFCCYTGIRFSDFVSMREENIEVTRGETWVRFRAKKTGTDVSIPIFMLFGGKGVDILSSYTIGEFTSIGNNADVNRRLAEIVKSAGITKRVTFHTARHTCATLLISQGVPITTVQKILGHSSVKTTQIYSDVSGDTIVKDLQNTFVNINGYSAELMQNRILETVDHNDDTIPLHQKNNTHLC